MIGQPSISKLLAKELMLFGYQVRAVFLNETLAENMSRTFKVVNSAFIVLNKGPALMKLLSKV